MCLLPGLGFEPWMFLAAAAVLGAIFLLIGPSGRGKQ
jgi:hypothetical protein